MLTVQNLTLTHKKDLVSLIEDLSFAVHPGERLALIGEEGNGKSTLLKLIYNPALVEDYAEYSGEIITESTVFGYLPQELPEAEKALSAAEFLTEKGFFDLPYDEGAVLCRELGIEYERCWSEQRMGAFSGG